MEGVPIEDTMLSDMCPDIESAFCFPHKYRTINGECNNVKNPTWGITGAAYLRILQPTYQDGRSTRHPVDLHVSFPQLEELISPHMCRSKPRINEEKQIGEVFYISGRFCPYDLHSRYKNT